MTRRRSDPELLALVEAEVGDGEVWITEGASTSSGRTTAALPMTVAAKAPRG